MIKFSVEHSDTDRNDLGSEDELPDLVSLFGDFPTELPDLADAEVEEILRPGEKRRADPMWGSDDTPLVKRYLKDQEEFFIKTLGKYMLI